MPDEAFAGLFKFAFTSAAHVPHHEPAPAPDGLQSCQERALIRIETKAGHGAGKPTTKIIEENADKLAFLTKELGMK